MLLIQSSRWAKVLGTLALVGALSALALLVTGRGESVANAAADGPSASALATVTVVARRTEQLHTAHVQMDFGRTDENSPAPAATSPLLSPEQAVAAVQRAGLIASNRPVWVSLGTDSSGQPVYVVRVGGEGGQMQRVDGRTGRILPALGR
ncbi:MAG TPA: PepSY domain-containing protein [Chloroflexota bacterium]|nr:PepSY domain-containing protein [Chloroflexota bacterium]